MKKLTCCLTIFILVVVTFAAILIWSQVKAQVIDPDPYPAPAPDYQETPYCLACIDQTGSEAGWPTFSPYPAPVWDWTNITPPAAGLEAPTIPTPLPWMFAQPPVFDTPVPPPQRGPAPALHPFQQPIFDTSVPAEDILHPAVHRPTLQPVITVDPSPAAPARDLRKVQAI